MIGMESFHSNYREDRQYSGFFTRGKYGVDDWMLTDCTGLKSVNEFDKDINVVLGSNKVIAGNE